MALAIFDLDETLIHGDCASLWAQHMADIQWVDGESFLCLLYTSPSPRDKRQSRMPSSA